MGAMAYYRQINRSSWHERRSFVSIWPLNLPQGSCASSPCPQSPQWTPPLFTTWGFCFLQHFPHYLHIFIATSLHIVLELQKSSSRFSNSDASGEIENGPPHGKQNLLQPLHFLGILLVLLAVSTNKQRFFSCNPWNPYLDNNGRAPMIRNPNPQQILWIVNTNLVSG